MSQPDGLPPLFDAGNTAISIAPCHMVTGKIQTADGERGVLTIRNANTTLTVILGKAEVKQWLDVLAGLHGSLSGAGLIIPGPADAARVNGQAR
jgi:hypothetical protein